MPIKLEIEVNPVYIPLGNTETGSIKWRRFQEELAKYTGNCFIVLEAPTGSGKTVTLLTDHENGIALGLYPNNQLVCSQATSIGLLLKKAGMKQIEQGFQEACRSILIGEEPKEPKPPVDIYESESGLDFFGRRVRRVWILGLAGKLLSDVKGRKLETIRNTLRRLMENRKQDDYGVILGTPDTFFLLASYTYVGFEIAGKVLDLLLKTHGSGVKWGFEEFNRALMKLGVTRDILTQTSQVINPIIMGSTIFIDEYHIYGPFEYSSLKLLMYTLKINNFNGRIILSSATPVEEAAKELSHELDEDFKQIKVVDVYKSVKNSGDPLELIRGRTIVHFIGLEDTKTRRKIGQLYEASARSHELIEYIRKHIDATEKAIAMYIVEKVSHAEVMARRILESFGVKPTCIYSTPNEDYCINDPQVPSQHIVGTGAAIGQGVEYPNVKYGIVARITTTDYIQSFGRICRGIEEECHVYTYVPENTLEKAMENNKLGDSRLDYIDFIESLGKLKMFYDARSVIRDRIIAGLIESRNNLLRSYITYLFYRETGSKTVMERQLSELAKVRVVASPEELAQLATFRHSGIEISYKRQGTKSEKKADLAVLLRNYEIVGVEDSAIVIGDIKSSSQEVGVYVDCKKRIDTIISNYYVIGERFLRDVLECKLMINNVEIKLQNGGKLWIYVDHLGNDVEEYLVSRGEAYRVNPKGILIPL